MDVLDERVEARVAVGAANGEQRQLAVERDALLQDVTGVWSLPRLHQALALAVVAEPARLQDRRELVDLVVQLRRRDPEPAEELLLDEPVL